MESYGIGAHPSGSSSDIKGRVNKIRHCMVAAA